MQMWWGKKTVPMTMSRSPLKSVTPLTLKKIKGWSFFLIDVLIYIVFLSLSLSLKIPEYFLETKKKTKMAESSTDECHVRSISAGGKGVIFFYIYNKLSISFKSLN